MEWTLACLYYITFWVENFPIYIPCHRPVASGYLRTCGIPFSLYIDDRLNGELLTCQVPLSGPEFWGRSCPRPSDSKFPITGHPRESHHESTEFISPFFLRKKKSVESCVLLMKPIYFMASIDHSDAYFSVPVDPSHKNTLDFYGKGDYISSLVLQKDSHVLLGYSITFSNLCSCIYDL